VEQLRSAEEGQRRLPIFLSYRQTLQKSQTIRFAWVTWLLTLGMLLLWLLTAVQAAWLDGAQQPMAILQHIWANALEIQDQSNEAITSILLQYGAKDNQLILQGEYWRFLTAIFLHANLLHVGLNLLNFLFLGITLERLFGRASFLFIFLITGLISTICSFLFSPSAISVGASGAIFGLVGAYSLFIWRHRLAFPRNGLGAILWLVIVIGANLGIGFALTNVDNMAHLGGLISGGMLGLLFTPFYHVGEDGLARNQQSLLRRWPLALLTLFCTIVIAIIALLLHPR
jgi:rhomboid protease GluP